MGHDNPVQHFHSYTFFFLFIFLLTSLGTVRADTKDDIGYWDLVDAVGSALPQGADVIFTQIEAPLDGNWMPDADHSEFIGKTITDRTGGATGDSSHATIVGYLLYGNISSLSPEALQIDIYEANNWVGIGFLGTGYTLAGKPFQPHYDHSVYPWILASPSRVANHSWIGTTSGSDPLRRMDFVVETDEFIQVVAVNNNSTTGTLWNSAFNTIAVGRTNGGYPQTTLHIDSVYHAGLTRPHIVAPKNTTSDAAPIAASSCALLVEAGTDPVLSADPVAQYTTNRNNRIIYNAERSEVIKAALMAGADRITHNTTTSDLLNYRNPSNRSNNGLDLRYGAGQLNIYQSYTIITSGEQNSKEDNPSQNGQIGWKGFDYDPEFGGLNNSNSVATYLFEADSDHRRLYASLVWNIDIAGGDWNDFNNSATLRNMDLVLSDTTAPDASLILAASQSETENSEHLWVSLLPGHSYQLRVSAQGDPFLWDYALAWRIQTPGDTDQDQLPDDWEVEYALNPANPDDASLDPDGDTLANLQEYNNGTDPGNIDTDFDGSGDGIEVIAGTDPLNPESHPEPVTALSPFPFILLSLIILLIGMGRSVSRKS